MLKLFHSWVSEESVQYEARIARAVHAAGLAVPRAGEIVKVDGRLGLEYERRDGKPIPLQETCVQALARMPEGDRLCHGDFHALSVLLHRGRASIIDWVDATYGNPLADVARIAVILRGIESRAAENKAGKSAWIEMLAMRWFNNIYLRRYFALLPGGEAEYQRWWPIVAAGRIHEDIPGLNDWLRQQVERELA